MGSDHGINLSGAMLNQRRLDYISVDEDTHPLWRTIVNPHRERERERERERQDIL